MNNLAQFSIYVFLLLFSVSVQAQGISFEHGSWEEVTAKAKEENKPIFVDAYTTWCGPCKWMAKNTFTQEEVGSYMDENFIAYKMDMEKGEGPAFAKKHKVAAFPTLLYFSAEGELLHKGVGALDADGLIALSKEAMDPAKQLATFHKKFADGKEDIDFLKNYVLLLVGAYEDAEAPFEKYWKKLDDAAKYDAEVLDILWQVTQRFADYRNEYTRFFIDNRSKYAETVDADKMTTYQSAAYRNAVWQITRVQDKKEAKKMLKEVTSMFPTYKKEIKPYLGYIKARGSKDADQLKKASRKYLKVTTNAYFLNNYAWNAFEKGETTKELKQGLSWINRALEQEENFAFMDTKAALLFRLERLKEAKAAAEKAIALAKAAEQEIDFSNTEELLKKINKEIENNS